MAKLHAGLIWPGSAQGKYTVKAKGFFLAVLSWGTVDGPLPGWGPFGYVPVDPAGNGSFFLSGMRGIPVGATHVWARCVSHDFIAFEEVSEAIPERYLPAASDAPSQSFSILTDMHLSAKPWRIRQALRAAEGDAILLLGDSTNDGFSKQFEDLDACIRDVAPNSIILPVIGNHDIVHPKFSDEGSQNYAGFQEKRLAYAETRGLVFERDPDSLAWATRMGALDVIGLQCVTDGRRFLFPEEKQLDWLEHRLSAQSDADWHVILCHAPLLHHNPSRSDGQPYLDKDKRLQRLIDETGRIVFLSGHTHISPNIMKGSAEWDMEAHNLYLNCGSLVDTATEGETGLMSAEWKDGCITGLSFAGDVIEITMYSALSGICFPRGYYRFSDMFTQDHQKAIFKK